MIKKETILLLFAFAFTSCLEVALEPLPDKGEVSVSLRWAEAPAPERVTYVFYPATGLPVTFDGGGSAFTGELPASTYRMLAYESGVEGVSFTGLDSYATAAVSARALPSARSEVRLVAQPGRFFSGSLEGLVVHPLDTVRTGTAARQLTRSLTLTFNLSEVAGVDELEGTLCGVYPSALLATGEPSLESVASAPSVGTAFGASTNMERKVAVTVRFLGLRNPEGGAVYTNTLGLTLKGADGWRQHTSVDLTRALTDVFAVGGDKLAFEIPTNIEVKVEPTPVSLVATVVGWTLGEGGGEIDYVYPKN